MNFELRLIAENNYLKFMEYCNDELFSNTHILNLDDLEYVKKLQEENRKQKERIEYLERSNNRREDNISGQRQKINDLEDNWFKLREYIKDFIPETYVYNKPYGKIYKQGQIDVSQAILLKMFELERK